MMYSLVFILFCLSLAHGYTPRVKPSFTSFPDAKSMATDPPSDFTPISKQTSVTFEANTDTQSYNAPIDSKWFMKGFKVSKTAPKFMATIREYPSDLYLCSATFIRKDALLTTARCLLGRDIEKLSVHSNSTHLETEGLGNTAIKNVFLHPDFDMFPVTMDFGIIILKKPIDYVSPVYLPKNKIGRPGTVGTMYTWRFTLISDKFLIHEHKSRIISSAKCFLLEQEIIPDDMVCAEGLPYQEGKFDHGMPFIINKKGKDYLFGINHITGKIVTEKVDKIWKVEGIVDWIIEMLMEDSIKRKRPIAEKTAVVTDDDDNQDNNVDIDEEEEDEEEKEKEKEKEEEENDM